MAIAWQSPWRGSRPLFLRDSTSVPPRVIRAAEEHCNLPTLSVLPPELVPEVRAHSSASLYWKYLSVMDLVDKFRDCGEGSGELVSRPLEDISAWKRGSRPKFAAEPAGRAVRLTLDARGIMQIERLQALEDVLPLHNSDTKAFVVLHVDQLRDIIANFRV